MKHFEVANADDPEELIKAAQRAVISSMKRVLADFKNDVNMKAPGLTWEQLEYFLDEFAKKEPEIIKQEHEL